MKKQDNAIIGIYKITSPTNKVYIGQSINLIKRINRYKMLKCSRQPKIYNSLKKYGVENHIFEIIEECSEELLNEREIYWKQQIVNKLGWNKALFCQLNDNKGGKQSLGTKLLKKQVAIDKGFGKWNKGKKRSDISKQKLSNSKIGNQNKKNKTHSIESKTKMSLAQKGRKITWGDKISNSNNKPVYQYDLKGRLIAEYKSITHASKLTGSHISVISNSIIKKRKTRKNHIWVFK